MAEEQADETQQSQEEEEKEPVFPDDYYKHDTKDAYKDITSMPHHVREGYRLGSDVHLKGKVRNIVVAGMGGSGIAGDLLKAYLDNQEDTPLTVETARGYTAPKSVGKETLFIAISYSGNTEETLSMYKTALRKGCQALSLSSGGKLEELAKLNKHPHIRLPRGLQPRMAVAYLFFPLIKVLENAKVIGDESESVKQLADTLKHQHMMQKAIDLSAKCYEKTPLIWADQSFHPVAYRWKTQFNENAKTPAFSHSFSELNHNEILAFTNRNSSYHAVLISTDREHRRIAKRIGLTRDHLQTKGVSVTELNTKGPLLKQIFTTIYLGDLTSYFLALRYETDPTPVTAIEQFKEKMGPFLI
ncbi:MAG: bifunctional phosphoglucose/phosphomannose isomerase [Candidatus Woesearchaeota archaeon]